MVLDLQKFLKEHPKNWRDILKKSPFDLIINERDGLVIFKYVQFASDFNKELVRESRGIILEKGTWNIACLPFSKFFNFGEPNAYDLTLANASIIEKIDGSIIKIYYYGEKWRVATNGTIDAEDACTYDNKTTFKDLFFDIISPDRFEKLTSYLYKDNTYLFELVHPMSRVVVDYEGKKELVFIGVRNNKTLVDDDIFQLQSSFVDYFNEIRLPKVYTLNIRDLSELSEFANTVNESGVQFEGFVVAESIGTQIKGRVKIKSPKYLKLHRLTGGEGVSNNIINILLDGEQDEFEAYVNQLPDYIKNEYKETKEKFERFLIKLQKLFNQYSVIAKHITRKELARDILKTVPREWSGFIFTHIDRGGSPLEILRNRMNATKTLKKLLEK